MGTGKLRSRESTVILIITIQPSLTHVSVLLYALSGALHIYKGIKLGLPSQPQFWNLPIC